MITVGLENNELYALDDWLVTRDVVSAIGTLYEDATQDELFNDDKRLVDSLFERSENADDVRATIARNM